jgi:hypothetical protein
MESDNDAGETHCMTGYVRCHPEFLAEAPGAS